MTDLLIDNEVPIPRVFPWVLNGCAMGPGPACVAVENVFAGGPINNPALNLIPVIGLQIAPIFGLNPTQPIGVNLITPGLFPTVQGVVQRLPDTVDIVGLTSFSATAPAPET